MSVTEDQIIKDVQKVCTQAIEFGKHLDLTVRGVIQQLINDLKHDEGFVNSKPIKTLIKITATQCLQSSNEPKPEPNPTDQKQNGNKQSADRTEKMTIQEDSVDQSKTTKSKKDSPSSLDESTGPASRPPSKKRARTSNKSGFKSSEMIDSDGNSVQENEESTSTIKPTSDPKVKRGRKPKSTKKDGLAQESKKNVDDTSDPRSEGEGKPTSSTPAPKSGKGKRRESLPVDKDEEKIKKLKAFVVACGVRKQWKKEFQDLPTNKQQIARLTTILEGLGMTGRMSMNKAKEIRERRDLEAEVSELVTTRETESSDDEDGDEEEDGEQDQAAGDGDKKKNQPKKRRKNRTVNASSGDESSDAPNKPKKKKNPFAFLGDQGSDDSS